MKNLRSLPSQHCKEVDKLTHSTMNNVSYPEVPTMNTRFLLQQNKNIIEGNYYQILHNKLKELDLKEWKTQGTTLKMILDPTVDRQRSTWPLEHNAARMERNSTIFKHK